jgi:hypothetical protein
MKKAIFAAAVLALSSAFAAATPASTTNAIVTTSGPTTASFVCDPAMKPTNPGIRIKDPCYPPPPPPPTGA